MDCKNNLPIAVIDSGIGGISVLRELIKIMPNENYIYFGDNANAPYGTKSRAEVLELTRKNLNNLISQGIKALVIACNTATSAAAKILREEYPDLLIVGIEPAIKPALTLLKSPKVLVMATPLTLREEKFLALVSKYASPEQIISLPCAGLVELIEKGELDSPEIKAFIENLLAPYKKEKIDAVVLGCTHYPHIKSLISSHFPKSTRIFDGGEGTARYTKKRLAELDLLNRQNSCGQVKITSSAPSQDIIELAYKLLNI